MALVFHPLDNNPQTTEDPQMNTPFAEVPPGYMKDSKGRLCPTANVSETDQLEDQLVKTIHGFAGELSEQIARFKAHTFDDVGAFLALLDEKYGVKKGGTKGNMTFTSFDGCRRVKIAVQDHMHFGPELQIAKTLIDECIGDWAADSNANIRALVNHAFAVDKEGQVNREAIFSLRRISIDDERWNRAIDAINDSIRITGSKTYVTFHRRDTPGDRWEPITIDLAAAKAPKAQNGEIDQ